MRDIEIEIRLNPYAFFTTALKSLADPTMAPRTWYIKNFQLNLDVWYYEEMINSSINAALDGEGLIISS